MKRKFLAIVIVILVIITIAIILVFVKPNKNLKLTTDNLISITIKKHDEEIIILKKDFDSLIMEFNDLKYKSKKTNVKTRGEYSIIFDYSNDKIELRKYVSDFSGESKYTLFKDDFDELVEKWISNYNK